MIVTTISQFFKRFYSQHVTKQDKLLGLLLLIIATGGCLCWALNGLFFHYSGRSFLPWTWVAASPIILGLMILARLVKTSSPRVSRYTNTYGTYYFVSIALGIMCNGIQYTPFPLFDHALLHFDQLLHFHQPALISWTSAHPHVYISAAFCYDALIFELLLLPPLFSLGRNESAVYGFFVAALLTYIVGMLIYYFLPSNGPVDVLTSVHFNSSQNQIYLRFFEVHHFLSVHRNVGLIAFPSFHVVWAVLLTYMVRRNKWLLYPALLVNTGAVLATLLLGWHFLADVLAGFVLATLAILASHRLQGSKSCITTTISP